MTSLKQLYQEECSSLNIKCNSAILAQLPDTADGFTEWDLSGNIVGTRGVVAVLKIVSTNLPELKVLNLSGNNLASAATKDLLHHLVDHPSLKEINLSNNDIRLGGPELVELLKRNKKITKMNIDGTFLRPLFVRLIAIQLKKNEGAEVTGSNGSKTRFSFGEANPAATDAFATGEEDAFGTFQSQLLTNAHDGPKREAVPRRPTVCSEVYKEEEIDNFTPEVIEKDEKLFNWLMTLLERHDLFSHLEDFELSVAVNAMYEVSRSKGDNLFEQGDEGCDLFYVIASGEVELFVDGEVVGTLKRGDCAHDLMLMYSGISPETGVCKTDVSFCTLDRQTYRCVLSKASKKKRAMYEGFLSSVSFLKCLTKAELLQLADALKPAQYEAGQSLIHYGEIGESFFLIVEGVVDVWGRNDSGEVVWVCDFTTGDCVGELEFINNHKCVADVKAKTFVRTAKMNRHHFEMVMGPVKEVLARNASESEVYTYYRHQLEKMDKDKPE